MMFLLPFLLPLAIPPLLKLITMFLSSEARSSKEKMSPFECGFDPITGTRHPFSLQFFLLTVVFLIFDVEISILLATPMALSRMPLIHYLLPLFLFLSILMFSLAHEWNEGALQWKSRETT